MTQSEGQPPPLRFIREGRDLPDAFGAHTRLARAMQVALLTNPTLEVVGLFGAWGSGKSKVMKLLEADMTTEKTRFFTYDAWVHQSDAPRRAFLEALIAFLEKEKLVDPEGLSTALAKLLKKTETVEVESQPEVSIRLGLVLSILLLVPVASQFLRADWIKPVAGELTWWFLGRPYSPYFTVALYLTLFPSLALAVVTSVRVVMHAFGKTVGGGLTALFVNKGKEVRRDQKRTDPEPTALEFQKFFRDLLAQVETAGGRRLIFVVDNLDRLPDQELMSLWSSIRSLFHGDPMDATAQRPTLLLPLDFGAVERVYEAKQGVAQGFADKTFDIVFRVPPPVSSQWQDYLRARIDEVFGVNARPDWKKIAIRVLEDAEVDSRLPRAINIYVNELATLWLQWRDDDVSFAAIAYYAANRDAIERNAWRSLQLQINWMTDFDPNWARGVAALRFGAPPVLAYQILLEQPLREAIVASDTSAFVALSRHAGFGTILRRSVEAYRTNTTSLPLTNTAKLLADLNENTDHNIGLAWSCLADGLRTGAWDPRDEAGAQAFDLILRNNPAGGRSRARAAVRDRMEQWAAGDVTSAVKPIVEVLRLAAQSAKDDGVGFGRVTLQVDAAGALIFAEALGEDAGLVNVRIEPTSLAVALVHHKAIDEKSLRSVVAAVLAWQLPSVWRHLIDIAPANVMARNADGAAEVCLLLGETWRLVPDIRQKMQEVLRAETFVLHLAQLITTSDGARAGIITALLMLPEAPDPRVGSIWERNRRLAGFMESFDSHLARFAPDLTVDDLIGRAIMTPEVKELIQVVIARRGSAGTLSVKPANVAGHLDAYLELLLPDKHAGFWKLTLADEAFWGRLGKAPYRNGDLALADRLADLANAGPGRVLARDFRAQRVEAASSAAWQAALEEGGLLFDALDQMGKGFGKALEQSIREGLTRSAVSLVKIENPAFERRWFAAAKRLRSKSQNMAYRTLWNRLVEPGVKRPVRVLRAGGSPFLKALRSQKSLEKVLQQVVVRGLGNSNDLRWLAEHLPFVASAAAAASEKSLANAIAIIDQRTSSPPLQPEDTLASQRLSERLKKTLDDKARGSAEQ